MQKRNDYKKKKKKLSLVNNILDKSLKNPNND